MADEAYLTIDEFKQDTGGWDITDIGDTELGNMLLRASELIDDYTLATWGYQDVQDEVHEYKTIGRPIYLRRRPVRVIKNFRILIGTSMSLNNSLSTSFGTIPTTPVGPQWLQPGQLPTQFGYIILDRSMDRIEISVTTFNIRILGMPWLNGLERPKILISYTAGYNRELDDLGNPYIAPDGYTSPYPTWLKQATRLITGALIGSRNTRAQGLGGVSQVRQGDSEFRLEKNAPGDSDASDIIPNEALLYLRRKRRTVVV
jgi:hypothetical protein